MLTNVFRLATATSITLDPGNWLAWVVAGLIAGWLAGLLVRGHGFGCLGNIVLGLVGAFIGGVIVSLIPLDLPAVYHFWGTVVVAFLGALLLTAIGRLIGGSAKRSLRRY